MNLGKSEIEATPGKHNRSERGPSLGKRKREAGTPHLAPEADRTRSWALQVEEAKTEQENKP